MKQRNPFVKDVISIVVLFILSYLMFSRGVLLLAVPLALGGTYYVGLDMYVLYMHFRREKDGGKS